MFVTLKHNARMKKHTFVYSFGCHFTGAMSILGSNETVDPSLGKFCGSNDANRVSTGSVMLVIFKSDYSQSGYTGFRAVYRSGDRGGCRRVVAPCTRRLKRVI